MAAVVVGDVPGWREWLEERALNGQDKRDEVWEGILHVVPPPGTPHQALSRDLLLVLHPIVQAMGLKLFYEMGLFRSSEDPSTNYRTPDLIVVDPTDLSHRGAEGHAELVVEILSKHDESRKKFDYYAACNVPEFWIVDPATRVVEVYTLRDGVYVPQQRLEKGAVEAPRLKLTLQIISGPKLRVTSGDQSSDV